MIYAFSIFADYSQFFLEDDVDEDKDLDALWTVETIANKFVAREGVVAILVARNTIIPVTLEILGSCSAISYDANEWDHIVQTNLAIISGTLVVRGTTEYAQTVNRIKVPTGNYRVTILYGGLESISEDGLRGNDRYKIILCPNRDNVSRVVKSHSMN